MSMNNYKPGRTQVQLIHFHKRIQNLYSHLIRKLKKIYAKNFLTFNFLQDMVLEDVTEL